MGVPHTSAAVGGGMTFLVGPVVTIQRDGSHIQATKNGSAVWTP